MNPTLRIGKVIRTLGLMGIMMALAGFMAAAPSASAGRIGPRTSPGPIAEFGKLNVVAEIGAPGSSFIPVYITVADSEGKIVAEGLAAGDRSFGAKLLTGVYKVNLTAPGYKPFSEIVKLAGQSTTNIKAVLEVEAVPSTSNAFPPMENDGKLNVMAIFPPTSANVLIANIAVVDSDGNTVAQGFAASDGSYVTTLAPGAYKVFVTAPGFSEYSEVIKMASDDAVVVTAVLNHADGLPGQSDPPSGK